MRSLLLALIALVALASNAHAEALAICHDGGPGSTKQAAKAVDTFLRHTETTAGLAPGSLTGEYHTRRASCEAYVRANSPVLVVLDLATHLSKARAWKLQPIAHLGPPDAITWHVVVREGTTKDLAGLAGKAAIVAAPEDAVFLTKIALGGAAPVMTFEHTRRPLKALRKVGRGKTDAALVDHQAVAHMAELDLPHTLVSIHHSEGLPGLTMSAVGRGGTVDKVAAAVSKLCDGEGRKLCKTFGVQRFHAPERKRLDALLERYGAGK